MGLVKTRRLAAIWKDGGAINGFWMKTRNEGKSFCD